VEHLRDALTTVALLHRAQSVDKDEAATDGEQTVHALLVPKNMYLLHQP
jgi:hypothetical protein